MKKAVIIVTSMIIFLLMLTSSSFGTTLFGPKQYDRTTGSPNVYSDSFTTTANQGMLIIRNGDAEDNHRVTSALIFVNGVQYFEPKDFKQKVPLLEVPIDLAFTNELVVELRSKPGTFLTIEIIGETSGSPTVSIQANPESIQFGASSTLSWTSENAESCTIDPGIGGVDLNGSIMVSPSKTTTFIITATGLGGTSTSTATVVVKNDTIPTVNLSADPLTIECGGPSDNEEVIIGCSSDYTTLTWSSTNAETCFIEPDVGYVDLNGSTSVWIDKTTTYTITATGPGGAATQEITVTVIYPPPTLWATFSPPNIMVGSKSVLEWESQIADTCVIEPGIGTVSVGGSMYVSPTQTTEYTITASGPGGTTIRKVTLTVNYPPPTVGIQVNPNILQAGESTTLTWDTTYADTCTINPGVGNVPVDGSISVTPIQNTTYTLTAVGPGGTSATQATVYLQPTVTLNADKANIQIGAPVILSWQSTDASSCMIEPGNILCEDIKGSIEVFPTEATQYMITATGGGGTATASASVEVYNPFTIEITTPVEGAVIGRPDVMVEGTISHADGLETGVVVNGVKAMVYENKFVANHVPLQNDVDTIVVTVTDTDGATAKKAISLNYVPENAYITINALPASGLSSFETKLTMDGTFSILNSTVTETGPGTVAYIETGIEEYKAQVTGEGFFYFTAQVTDAESITHTDTIAVLAQDRNRFDAFLKTKWEGMKTGLRNKDVNAAVHHIAENKKAMYEYNYNLLIDHLPAIEAEFHGITLVNMRDGIAEYALDSEQEGQRYSFYVLFIKDTDGIWRISFF